MSRAQGDSDTKAWMRLVEVVLSGPVIGALFVLLLTAAAFAGGDDDRLQGVRATAIVDLARRNFAADVRGLTVAFVAIAIGLGAAIGLVAELMIALRRATGRGLETVAMRSIARVALVVALYGALFCLAVARMPQLYAESLYLREGSLAAWTRTAQIVITDVLGVRGVIALSLFGIAAFVVPARDRIRSAVQTIPRRMIYGAPLILVVLVLATLGMANRGPRKSTRKGGAPNVVILAVDSLRDDRLVPRTAPKLSALARDGVRFTRAYVTLPRTLPSWTTILTGREPHAHGMRTMFPRYEDRARDLSALPARLKTLGYKSAVVGDYAADIFTRVRYGFDIVDAPTFNFHALIATRALAKATPLLPVLHGRLGRSMMPAMRELAQASDPQMVAADAKRAIDRVGGGDQPFFLTVFFSTAHFPYAAPAPYYARFTDPAYRGRFRYHKPNLLGQEAALDASDIKQVHALYDGAVAAVDDAAASILDDLRARGLDDDTIVIVTSDHGEMLFDDGHGQGHGDHLFGDQVVHVPLAMRVPARFGTRAALQIDQLVRDVDLAPTLLDMVAAPAALASGLDGRSLRPLMQGQALPPRPAFGETEVWYTESIAELPSSGPNALRIPYPNVAGVTELDPRLAHDVVMRPEAEPMVIAAKHRMVIDGNQKLVYVPTRRGVRWFLYDRSTDPAEVFDVSSKRPDEVARLKGLLFRWMLGDPRMEERDGMLMPRGEAMRSFDVAALRVP